MEPLSDKLVSMQLPLQVNPTVCMKDQGDRGGMMESLSDRRVSMQLPVQVNPRMHGFFHQNNVSLPPLVQAEGDTSLSRDMDSKKSNIRGPMRKHILEYMNRRPECSKWVRSTREIAAKIFDDKLYTRADTERCYFDLGTLESRLDDLMSSFQKADTRKDVTFDISRPHFGPSERSSEIPPNDGTHSTSPFPYNNLSPTRSRDDMSPSIVWSSLPKSATPLHINGLSTSHGDKQGRKSRNMHLPMVRTSRDFNTSTPSSAAATSVPLKQYTEAQDCLILQNRFDNGWSSTLKMPCGSNTKDMQATNREKASEGCMFYDLHGVKNFASNNRYSAEVANGYAPALYSSKAPTNMNPSQTLSNSTMKSTGVHPRSSQQSEQQSMQVTECHVESPSIDPLIARSEKGHLSRPRQVMGELQPPFYPCEQFKQPEQQQVLHKPHAVQDAIQPQTSLEGSISDGSTVSYGLVDACLSGERGGVHNTKTKRKIIISVCQHVKNCSHQGTECNYPGCVSMKQKLSHMYSCNCTRCAKKRFKYKSLFPHFREFNNSSCGVSVPVRMKPGNFKVGPPSSILHTSSSATQSACTLGCSEPPLKRMKKMNYSPSSQSGTAQMSPLAMDTSPSSQGLHRVCKEVSTPQNALTETMKMDMSPYAISSKESHVGASVQDSDIMIKPLLRFEPLQSEGIVRQCKQVREIINTEIGEEVVSMTSTSSALNQTGPILGKIKVKGLSLIDSFTPDEVREHIRRLMQANDQEKAVTERKHGMECPTDANKCSLCGTENLHFEVPSRYCGSCSKQINPKGVFYSMKGACNTESGGGAQNSFCSKCYNVSGECIKVGGQDIRKANLERRCNYAVADADPEWMVQCDKCQSWQHQICALFNGRKNKSIKAKYTCPHCFLDDINTGVCKPLPKSKALAAKDLPTTVLSDYIEQWLFRRLEQERQDRANALQKNFHEVPGADDLVIRVVSTVDKKAEVKQHFFELFRDEKYPAEFPYKSKAILLFQKIDGADVCLFGMYVQEYGSDCAFPNQRHVCISYIDSVKYFRPEIKTMTGEALRTFVYHEILISYLDYCKKRGFASCYIWSCPSLKQDDYILYCHPTVQKMPKSDKLREWYQMMIRKAARQKIVVESTNLYDSFFKSNSHCKPRVTASRLPYFDGDYWPGEAERFLQNGDKNGSQKKGGKAAIGRVLRAAKRDALTGNPKDILLMHQLGEIIRPIKEDFMIVHLCHVCKRCCQPIVSGSRWVCEVRKNFHLCDKCYYIEQSIENKDNNSINVKEGYSYYEVEVEGVPQDTDYNDGVVKSEYFDTRLVFLNLCQNNHYQFDTLRRAKHSTMMILHHLLNPVPTAFLSSCSACNNDIGRTQRWYCKTCLDYSLCESCYQRKGAGQHCHELVNDATVIDGDVVPHRRLRSRSFKILLNVLVHSSNCHVSGCNYENCSMLKRFFQHTRKCQIRSLGGCLRCKKMWIILYTHADSCRDVRCCVPRCKDLKDDPKQMQMLSNALRGAGVEVGIRQQESETL